MLLLYLLHFSQVRFLGGAGCRLRHWNLQNLHLLPRIFAALFRVLLVRTGVPAQRALHHGENVSEEREREADKGRQIYFVAVNAIWAKLKSIDDKNESGDDV